MFQASQVGPLSQILNRIRYWIAPRDGWREKLGGACLHAVRLARQKAWSLLRAPARYVFHMLPVGLRGRLRALIGSQYRRTHNLGRASIADVSTTDIAALVSIILPVYNQADLLNEAIESVLAQTYRDFELIVVNDGSTDGVESVLDKFVSHPKVRILTQTNQQLPKALSNAFEFASGEFWTWTSADNRMAPEQLSRLVSYLQTHAEIAMVYADYLAIDDQGQPLLDPGFRPHNRRTPDTPEIHLPRSTATLNTIKDNFIGPCFMYRGWVGRLLGEYDPNLGVEDYDYWMRLNSLFKIEHLGTDEVLYQYGVHDNTLNARAAELRIFDRADQLMVYESERSTFYRQPLTVYADAPTLAWLRRVETGLHNISEWKSNSSMEENPKQSMLLIHASSLPRLAEHSLPSAVRVAAWFDRDCENDTTPYRCRKEIQQRIDVCFANDHSLAARLELFHSRIFRVPPGQGLFDTALAYAQNNVFYTITRPDSLRERDLPEVYVPAERRLRILLQVDDFLQGGLEQVVIDLAICLEQEGFEICLLVLGQDGRAASQARDTGITVLTLPKQQREELYRQLLIERQIDLVNAHYSLFGAAISADLDIPFVQTIHNSYVWLPPWQIMAYQKNDRYTTAYVCVSANVACYSDLRLGLPASKMVCIPNGIDTALLDAADAPATRDHLRKELGLTPDDFVFLNVASLHAPKAQKLLVQAIGQIVRDCPRAKLVLVGRVMDDAYLDDIESEIAVHGLDGAIVFAGYRENVLPFYAMADAFVLPSFWEGWSLALAEALYAKLPIVASAVGGAEEQIAPNMGQRIQPPFVSITELDYSNLSLYIGRDQPQFVSDLAQGLKKVYTNPEPPELSEAVRRRLARESAYRAYVRLFQWLNQGGAPARTRSWSLQNCK